MTLIAGMAVNNSLKVRKPLRKQVKQINKKFTKHSIDHVTSYPSHFQEWLKSHLLLCFVVVVIAAAISLQTLLSLDILDSLRKEKTNTSNLDNINELPKATNSYLSDQKKRGKRKSTSYQNFIRPSRIQFQDKNISFKHIQHSNNHSSVEIFIFDNVLSKFESDSLCSVHSKHVGSITSTPLFCFESIQTLRFHLKELNLIQYRLTDKDFISGTTCLNESISSMLKPYFKFSYSTAFYPGESKFSSSFAVLLANLTGLKQNHGGKFQITSYGENVGYKSHLDCVISKEKRDRYATALIYLQDVPEGGETVFPKLNITIKPKQGRMLLWNSMDSNGNCDPTSLHYAAPVIRGHKFILQRWYYYQSFPQLGKRPPEPNTPHRQANTARIQCDDYKFGSCRWYDEWGYDHLIKYKAMKHSLT